MTMTDPKKNKRISRINIAISILLAFGAWLYVVMEVSPTITRTYSDIPIVCEGLDTLADEGLGVRSLSDDELRIKVRIERTEVLEIHSEDFKAFVDVRNSIKGSNSVEVRVVAPSGATVIEQSVEAVNVSVTSSLNRDVPVAASFKDSSDDSSEPEIVSIDSPKVSIIGAASEARKVAYAVVYVDNITPESGNKTGYRKSYVGKPVAVDSDGEIIPNIVVRPETVDIRYKASSVKLAALDIEIKGDSSKMDYELPESVAIKGASADIGSISTVKARLNLKDVTVSGTVALDYELPEGVTIANKSLSQGIYVKLK